MPGYGGGNAPRLDELGTGFDQGHGADGVNAAGRSSLFPRRYGDQGVAAVADAPRQWGAWLAERFPQEVSQ